MSNNKTDFIHFRVTPTEKEALSILALLENRKPSEMMRELIREGVRNRDIDFFNLEDVFERFSIERT